jgi:coenzyme PQQ precursor peptide PqqA
MAKSTTYLLVRVRSDSPKIPFQRRKMTMAWTSPVIIEICIGLEINGYLPAEF